MFIFLKYSRLKACPFQNTICHLVLNFETFWGFPPKNQNKQISRTTRVGLPL